MLQQLSVILYQPQIPENTGFIARTMNSFGCNDLRLISPAFKLNNDSPAYKTACGSHEILQRSNTFESFETAIIDSHHIIGFTRRNFSTPTKHRILEDWLQRNEQTKSTENIALVFGPEDYGLPHDIISKCTNTVEIPQHHETLSFNLSHAVTIVLYQMFISKMRIKKIFQSVEITTPINHEKIFLLCNTIKDLKINQSKPIHGKEKRHEEILLNFLQRTDITDDEYSVLMGFLK